MCHRGFDASAGQQLIFNSAASLPGGTLYQNRGATEHDLLNFKQIELQNPAAYVTVCLDEWHHEINLLDSVRGGVIGI